MEITLNPFFWSTLSMFALAGACAVVSGSKLGKHMLYGFFIVLLFISGRIILALPFIPQPRLEPHILYPVIGVLIFAAGLLLSIPGLSIKPFTSPEKNLKLRTTGLYAIVRNPIYLGEVLLSLGWSIIFGSIIGIMLTPFWWAGLLILTITEEASLERELGEEYIQYKKKVRGRIIPGLPI